MSDFTIEHAWALAGLPAAVLVLLGAVLALVAAARPWASLALPAALLLGMAGLLGIGLASPRQLGERLPMLALLACVPALLAAFRPGLLPLAIAAVLGGWWTSGAALTGADLGRAAMVWLALSAAMALAGVAMRGRGQGAILPLGLAGLLALSAPAGPWLDAALLLALLGVAGLGFGLALPAAGQVSLGPMLAALAAGPVIALGRPADWVVALAMLAAAAVPAAPGAAPRGWRGLAAQAVLLGAAAIFLAIARWV